MDELVQILRNGNHSLVVASDGIRTFDGRGISDLYTLLTEHPDWLRGASVADKVVGKGAAALLVSGGVKEVHADVISRPAFDLLESTGVPTTYEKMVPYIINRADTGLCPLEIRCKECVTPEECLVQIRLFVEEMNSVRSKLNKS